MFRLATALIALALAFVPSRADDSADIFSKVINIPAAKAWQAQGLSRNPEEIKDERVQGGEAVRFAIPEKGADPWSVTAKSNIVKPVQTGDVLFLMFYARAEVPIEGQQTALIPGIQIEESTPPYTALARESVTVTGKWQTFYLTAVAAKDYKPGSLTVTLHLAAAKQTIDFGPCFVVNLGPNYDRSKLPKNKLAAATPAAPPPASFGTAETRFATELARIRAMLPVRGKLMNDPAVTAIDAYGADQTNQRVPAPEVPGGQSFRVAVNKSGGDTFATGTAAKIFGDIRKGDVIFLAYYAKAVEASNEAQSGVISAYNVQQQPSPYVIAAGAAALVPLGSWRMFYVSGVAPMDYPSGTAVLTAQIGGRKQTIEFGPAFVLNLGPGVNLSALPVNKISYPGREPGAAWRAPAEARIKQLRMGDFRVAVTDAAGKPVPGASVHFAMQRHKFGFGSYVGFNFAAGTGPDADRVRQSFFDTFNFATAPIYWSDWGWADAKQRANFIASMKWLKERRIPFRGHTVVYPREDLTPASIKKLAGDKAAVRRAVLDHVRSVVPIAAANGAYCLDAVNEPRDGDYLKTIAGDDIFADVFRTAHEAAPDLKLFVNEYGMISGGGYNERYLSTYHRWIDDMLAKGVPVGGIGFQGHFGADLTNPARVIEVFDEFSRHKLPIHVTEFDVDTTDEDAQADYTRDMLTAVFSHPAAEAFIIWGWWEGDHWKPNGAMLRRDWSEKANYRAWKKLIYGDWWTDKTQAAGTDGVAAARAFHGDYRITVKSAAGAAEREVSFGPETGAVTISVK